MVTGSPINDIQEHAILSDGALNIKKTKFTERKFQIHLPVQITHKANIKSINEICLESRKHQDADNFTWDCCTLA